MFSWFGPSRTAFKNSLKQGFSLVELVIYISIVAILMAVIIPNASDYFKKAKKSSTEQNIKQIQQAIEMYNAHTNHYPETLRDLIMY